MQFDRGMLAGRAERIRQRAGLSLNFIAKVEARDRRPSLSSLDRIARVLGAKVRIDLVK
jgi:transcriptional regulator with XRE-family HTH domain